jgi:hypothetical protein
MSALVYAVFLAASTEPPATEERAPVQLAPVGWSKPTGDPGRPVR